MTVKRLTWPAPAKLNLMLHITARRADGYHELQTVFQFLDLCDEVTVELRDDGVICRLTGAEGISAEDDLLVRSARALQAYTGTSAGADLSLTKRIPMGAGLGGGSSMDCAKGINFIYTNGGQMKDYWGVGKALKEMLPMIAIPTTAGTGSETQSFALISDAKTHAKMACGDKKASFRVAILDPTITLTQPPQITALTGIDAIAHAVESFVTKPRNSVSQFFSREAWNLLAVNFPKVLADSNDLDARGAMQLGACFAGIAIENSMLGAAHSLANPLTANFGITHGQAVGVMLPHVVKFNSVNDPKMYSDLFPGISGVDCVDSLASFIQKELTESGLKKDLRSLDVTHESLPKLATEAATQWTAQFNPRPVDHESLLGIYSDAFE